MLFSAEWMGLPWIALVPLVLGLGWISQELSRSAAEAVGLLDHPNPRKIHARPVPLSGGPGIFGPLALGYLIWLLAGSPGMATAPALALGLAFTAIFMTGLIDDLRGISARKRLLIQAGAATLLWGAGFRIDDIAFGSWTLELSAASLPLTLFWFMGFMNTSNLMDGMDGLSGGMNLIALLALGGFGLYAGSPAAPLALAAAALTVAFLICNLRGRGKVFMGDSGSLSMGLGVAALALVIAGKPAAGPLLASAPAFAVAAYAIGILDVLLSIIRRRRRGVSPFRPDTQHIHHRLLRAGLGAGWTLATLHALAGMAVFAVALPFYGPPIALLHLLAPLTIIVAAGYKLLRLAMISQSHVIPLPLLEEEPAQVLQSEHRFRAAAADSALPQVTSIRK